MYVLGIETSCDETACAIVENGRRIVSHVVASQAELHQVYGGVVPEIACRRHIDLLFPVLEKTLAQGSLRMEDISLISVSSGPGLVGALLVGVNAAKALSYALRIPLVGVNHVEAHLYGAILSSESFPEFPAIGVVLSGGHSSVVYMNTLGSYQLLSQTVDDAIGEAFDKVARILHLPYPGGPEIEKLAKQGNPHAYPFRAGHVKESPKDFSFSGLKTAVLYEVQKGKCDIANVAASFQRAAIEDVVKKVTAMAQEHRCRTLIFGGGVTANQALRVAFAEHTVYRCYWPTIELSLDNAAMVAALGYDVYQSRGADSLDLMVGRRVPWS